MSIDDSGSLTKPKLTVSGLAKVGDPITHHKDSKIITGEPTVLICDKPAARLLDVVACPREHHNSTHETAKIRGPQGKFERNITIGPEGRMAAMIGDECFPCDNSCRHCDDPAVICPAEDSPLTTGGTTFPPPPPPPSLDVEGIADDLADKAKGAISNKVSELAGKVADKIKG